MIKLENVSGGYDGIFRLGAINVHVKKGEFFGIIGPNGSGKSTLVKMISGILPYDEGSIYIANRLISEYGTKQLAKKLAVLPQLTEQSFRFTVKETVALGRYAHQKGIFASLTAQDEAIIQEVMEQTDIARYADKTIDQLSGGERQRVFLAQALVQEPEVIILDEPTNHLDLAYQKELLDLLYIRTKKELVTVVAIFHDLNLASLYCDRLLLLYNGKVHICDEPNTVIKENHILDVYETEVERQAHPVIPKSQIMLTPYEMKNCLVKSLVDQSFLIKSNCIAFEANTPLKTVTTDSNTSNQGLWHDSFLHCFLSDAGEKERTTCQLADQGKSNRQPMKMITKARLKAYAIKRLRLTAFNLLILVTRTENVAEGEEEKNQELTSLQIWVFIEGNLRGNEFVQAIVAIAEAKEAILQKRKEGIAYREDDILVASSQTGPLLELEERKDLMKSLKDVVYQGIIEAFQKS